MLTLFRKIRRTLLKTSQTQKYLLYAVGEIALVVIGILIALQINNWNEERKNAIQELETIQSIFDEIQVNRVYHVTREGDLDQEFNNGRAILNLTGPNTQVVDKDSVLLLLHDFQYNPLYAPVTAKFNQLISGEDLNLISNDSMKLLFNEYSSILELTDQLSTILFSTSDKISDYFDRKGVGRHIVLKIGSYSTQISQNMVNSVENDLSKLDMSTFDLDIDGLLSDPEFESVISRRLRQVTYNKARVRSVKNHIDKLNEFIEHHYNIQ